MSLDVSAFTQQADWCRKLGSPFTALLLEVLCETLDETTATGRKVCNWPGTAGPMKDVVPLRLAAAFHGLILSQKAPALAPVFPPNTLPQKAALAKAVEQTLKDNDSRICAFLDHAPQTNEVARAVLLMAGLSTISARTNLPLELFEIGASGGLNLNLDRFAHQMGETNHGDPASAVKLAPDWKGPAPATAPIINSRAGCDLNPIDVTVSDQATRLTAYIWPDQPERLKRTKAAISIAQQYPPQLTKADAADWVEELLKHSPQQGCCRVLMHSIAWQYMPQPVQGRITQAMVSAAQTATTQTPLAWLAFELNSEGQAELTLRLWPASGKIETLAKANPHVHHIEWCP